MITLFSMILEKTVERLLQRGLITGIDLLMKEEEESK